MVIKALSSFLYVENLENDVNKPKLNKKNFKRRIFSPSFYHHHHNHHSHTKKTNKKEFSHHHQDRIALHTKKVTATILLHHSMSFHSLLLFFISLRIKSNNYFFRKQEQLIIRCIKFPQHTLWLSHIHTFKLILKKKKERMMILDHLQHDE